MPQSAWSPKRERQYEHIEESLEDRGTNEDKAEEIAARTVNKKTAPDQGHLRPESQRSERARHQRPLEDAQVAAGENPEPLIAAG